MCALCDNLEMKGKQIVVLYHKKCPDGFGAAYAAWKKYGDMAEYIPVGYGDPVITGLEGREVFIVDFCYELQGEIDRLKEVTKRLVILDHHESSKARVESVPEHIYDASRSGATIAWSYFHPHEPVPLLLQYVEDVDLYKYKLPQSAEMHAYLSIQPYDFALWDGLVHKLETPDQRAHILKAASFYSEYFDALVMQSVDTAKKVRFEGYTCYFATTHGAMRSQVAHELYEKLPPIALVVTAHTDGFAVSIRSDGSVDVSKIAEKYHGGGHPSASGFFIRNGVEMPWVEIEEE